MHSPQDKLGDDRCLRHSHLIPEKTTIEYFGMLGDVVSLNKDSGEVVAICSLSMENNDYLLMDTSGDSGVHDL